MHTHTLSLFLSSFSWLRYHLVPSCRFLYWVSFSDPWSPVSISLPVCIAYFLSLLLEHFFGIPVICLSLNSDILEFWSQIVPRVWLICIQYLVSTLLFLICRLFFSFVSLVSIFVSISRTVLWCLSLVTVLVFVSCWYSSLISGPYLSSPLSLFMVFSLFFVSALCCSSPSVVSGLCLWSLSLFSCPFSLIYYFLSRVSCVLSPASCVLSLVSAHWSLVCSMWSLSLF